MNNAEFDELIAMISDGRISRTEFLLKMQLRPLVVENIITLHKLPAAVTRNIDIGDLMFSDDEVLAISATPTNEEPIPEGVTYCPVHLTFFGDDGDERGPVFWRKWSARCSEFPVRK